MKNETFTIPKPESDTVPQKYFNHCPVEYIRNKGGGLLSCITTENKCAVSSFVLLRCSGLCNNLIK